MALAVCVCGWYLAEYDDLYRALFKLHAFRDTPVHVVANKGDLYLGVMGLAGLAVVGGRLDRLLLR